MIARDRATSRLEAKRTIVQRMYVCRAVQLRGSEAVRGKICRSGRESRWCMVTGSLGGTTRPGGRESRLRVARTSATRGPPAMPYRINEIAMWIFVIIFLRKKSRKIMFFGAVTIYDPGGGRAGCWSKQAGAGDPHLLATPRVTPLA